MRPQLKKHSAECWGISAMSVVVLGRGFVSPGWIKWLLSWKLGFWLLQLIKQGNATLAFMGKHFDIEEELGHVNR